MMSFCRKKLLNLGFARILSHFFILCTLVFLLHSSLLGFLFARASERRVLLIVEVCYTFSFLQIRLFSYRLIFTSSHLHIYISNPPSFLHIFTSSSHLYIFISAYLHIFPHLLHIFIFSLSLSCRLTCLLSCPFAFYYYVFPFFLMRFDY